jgi:curved DNA-binding protein CbpA
MLLLKCLSWTIMKNRRNYYRVLQVQPDAPPEIIHASYRTMMRELKCHPDLGGATLDASLLNEAYKTLSDPLRRAAYDKELFLKYSKQARHCVKQSLTPVFCPVCRRPLSRKPQPGEVCLTCRTPLQSDTPGTQERVNKRSLDRTKISDQIIYYSNWPGEAEQGRMLDFSPEGMRFVCGKKIALQTVLKISSRLLEASGTVTNLSEEIRNGEKCFVVGVCFLAIHFKKPQGTFLSTSA